MICPKMGIVRWPLEQSLLLKVFPAKCILLTSLRRKPSSNLDEQLRVSEPSPDISQLEIGAVPTYRDDIGSPFW
jgi:hypothetical protein